MQQHNHMHAYTRVFRQYDKVLTINRITLHASQLSENTTARKPFPYCDKGFSVCQNVPFHDTEKPVLMLKKADIVNKKLNEDIQDVPNHTSESIHLTDKPIIDTPQILFF